MMIVVMNSKPKIKTIKAVGLRMAWKVQIKIYTKILKVLASKIPSIQIILSSQSFYKPQIKQKIKIVLIIYRFLLNLQRKMISTLFRV